MYQYKEDFYHKTGKKIKILHLLYSHAFSGAENVVAGIIKNFDKEAEMIYVSPNGEIKKTLQGMSVPYIPLKNFKKKEIKKVIKKFQPDIIHAHDVRATIQAVRCAGKIPVLSHLHVNHRDMKIVSIRAILYLLYAKRVHYIIAVSKLIEKEYIFASILKKKIIVLHNIIDKNRILKKSVEGIESFPYDFIYLGRLDRQKNPEQVAQVAAMVLKKNPKLRFGIIGKGPLKKEMEKVLKENQVERQADFLGFIENPYFILKQAKVLIFCSQYEGLPMAALEALCLGIPIVSTPVDGLKEIIENGKNGYICEENQEFAEKVYHIITDKKLFLYLSKEAKQKSEVYTNYELYKEKLWDIYRTCIR